MTTDTIAIADVLGPWVEPDWENGLIERCRNAWNKPLRNLTNQELATLLNQRFAVEHILTIANKRILDGFDDDTEFYDGQLQSAIDYASKFA